MKTHRNCLRATANRELEKPHPVLRFGLVRTQTQIRGRHSKAKNNPSLGEHGGKQKAPLGERGDRDREQHT